MSEKFVLEGKLKAFIGVFCYEFRMSIRRWSLWLATGILMILHLTSVLLPPETFDLLPTGQGVLSYAGTFAYLLNLFMPVVGGILIADRLVRDQRIGVDELLRSTALKHAPYLAGKFFGALASITLPVLLCSLLMGVKTAALGAPVTIIPAMLLAFLGINLPAYILITAFSLACPLVIPVRVYQVLFTGYWFWGNYISPTVLPTLNGTILSANGGFVLTAFFGGFYRGFGPESAPLSNIGTALFNLLALSGCAFLALIAAERSLAWRAARA